MCINDVTLAGGCGGGRAGEGAGRARLGKTHPGSTKLLLDSQNWGRGGPASAQNTPFGVAGVRDNPSWGGVAGCAVGNPAHPSHSVRGSMGGPPHGSARPCALTSPRFAPIQTPPQPSWRCGATACAPVAQSITACRGGHAHSHTHPHIQPASPPPQDFTLARPGVQGAAAPSPPRVRGEEEGEER